MTEEILPTEYPVPDGLPVSPTWNILDSTKLNRWQECPRSYFFEYVLGWRPDTGSIHLDFGGAFHDALEVLMKTQEPRKGWTPEAVQQAKDAFLSSWRAKVPEERDLDHKSKNPVRAQIVLEDYAQHYASDTHTVEHTEIHGELMLSEKRTVHYKIDTLCRSTESGGMFVLEHKTTGADSKGWRDGWQTSLQVGMYYLSVLASTGETPDSVIINGFVLRSKDHLFIRVPINKSADQLHQFMWQITSLWNEIAHSHQVLSESSSSDDILYAFPQRTTSCTKWGRTCPFLPYCSTWANPLQHLHKRPLDMHIEHWDPSTHTVEEA